MVMIHLCLSQQNTRFLIGDCDGTAVDQGVVLRILNCARYRAKG